MNFWLLGKGWGEDIVMEFGIDMYTLLYLKWVTNKDLLCSTGRSIHCHVPDWIGVKFGGEWTHVYAWVGDFAVHRKLRWYSSKESSYQGRRRKRHGFNPWVAKIPWSTKW